MKTSDKIFKAGVSIILLIFAVLGLALSVSAWLMTGWQIELRIAATIFGFGFLFVPCLLIMYMLWEDN